MHGSRPGATKAQQSYVEEAQVSENTAVSGGYAIAAENS